MTVYHNKATAITNLDGLVSPFIRLRATAGEGAAQKLKEVSGFVAPTASAGVDSTIQLARVPSTAKIKEIKLNSISQGATGIYDLGVYYASDDLSADSKADGTILLAANTIDQDFFSASALDAGGNVAWFVGTPGLGILGLATTFSLAASAWTAAKANLPLWQAAGLPSDPGGNLDIVLTNTEAGGTGAANIGFSVRYAE